MLNTKHYLKQKLKANLLKYIGVSSLFLIFTLNILITGIANSDLSDGRFHLFMDETILFDHVQKILHYDSKEQLFELTVKSSKQYGAIFYYANALICFIPELIFGDKGLIYVGRMSGVIFLTLSYLIFSIAYMKNWLFRIFSTLILLNIPFNSYFMSMPKPEPLQLFFLSLFFYFFNRNNYSMKNKYWVFIGLALGTKISALPVVFAVIAFSIYYNSKYNNLTDTLNQIPKQIFYISSGLFIAEPILFKDYIFSVIAYLIIRKLIVSISLSFSKFKSFIIPFIIFFNIGIGFLLENFLNIKSGTYKWLTNTLLNTQHESDNSSITILSWIDYFLNEFLLGTFTFNIFFSTICLSYFILILFYFIKSESKIIFENFILQDLLLIISGASTIFLIFLKVDRTMGHYLTPWIIFILVGLIAATEKFILNKNIARTPIFLTKIVPVMFSFLICLLVAKWWYPDNIKEYYNLSNRTKTEKYEKNLNSYNEIVKFLYSYSKQKNRPIKTIYCARLFQPPKNKQFFIQRFWGPFVEWNAKYDVIVFSDSFNQSISKSLDENQVVYQRHLIERDGYKKYVLNENDNCISGNCYKRAKKLENGAEILILVEENED